MRGVRLGLALAWLVSCGGGSGDGKGGSSGTGAGGFGGSGAGGAGGGADPNFPVNEALAAQFIAKGLPADLARYFAAAKLESSSPDPRTFNFKYTFPNGATREITMVVTLNQSYTPSAEERARVAKRPIPIFNFKYTSAKNADGIPRITLTYFVPDQILPPELRGGSARPGGGIRRPLTRVIAQDSSSGAGVSWTETGSRGADLAIGTALDYGAQRGLPVNWAGNVYTLASALSDVSDAAQLSMQHRAWLRELAALEDCAARPTNPLALTDPGYSSRTVAQVQAARSELTEVTGVRYLNQLTSTATGLTPVTAVLGVALAQGFAWNESTLDDYSNNTIMEEVRRAVVPCGDRGMFTGNVEVMESCHFQSPSQTEDETRHITTMVGWVWEEATRQYRPRGMFRYEHVRRITAMRTCTITETAMGSVDNAGALTVIDDPAAWGVLGYGYIGAGDADARVGRVDSCSPANNTTFDDVIRWLPDIKGIPAAGGVIAGMNTEPTCQGNNSSGTRMWSWMFTLPPR